MDTASRRKFIQQTGTLAGGALAIGLTPAAAAASAQESPKSPPKVSKTQMLRALLQKPAVVMAPEAYTVITAKLAEIHGFEVVYIPGSMMSGTYLGVPDWGLISPTAMVDIAGHIAREISIPAISDADQAGTTALNVYHTVQQFERAGIAGIHIEDTLNPKHADQRSRSGLPRFSQPVDLESLERMVLRIRAAADARSDPDFVIIARTDEPEIDGILRRGNAFAKAGADVFMPRAVKVDQIDRITREVGLPLLGVNLPMRDVRGTQLKINVYAGLVSGPAVGLADILLRELKENGEVASRPELRLRAEVTAQLTNHAVYGDLAEKWIATP